MPNLVIKIGGSFLTKKSRSNDFPTSIEEIEAQRDRFVEWRYLRSLSWEIRRIAKANRMLIVHGAGPFGHSLVQRALSGLSIDPAVIHRSMLILNSAVLEALSDAGLQPRTTSPFETVRFNGRFRTDELVSLMKKHADEGLVPVSHGDVVRAVSAKGRLGDYEVISGDLVARDLALAWPADRLIMVTDVDGILDQDPSEGGGRTIPRISQADCLSLLRGRTAKGADVTGGIAQKIASCEDSIRSGIPLHIISGKRKGSLLEAARGGKVGTVVEAS